VRELGGSIARQIAQAGQCRYSIPWASCSLYEWGLASRQESALLVAMSLISLLSRTSNFLGNFAKFVISGFRDHCWGTHCESVIGW